MQTDFLVARPSFWSGAARVLDLFGLFDRYNASRTPAAADALALYSDWHMVGDDLRAAIAEYEAGPYVQERLFEGS